MAKGTLSDKATQLLSPLNALDIPVSTVAIYKPHLQTTILECRTILFKLQLAWGIFEAKHSDPPDSTRAFDCSAI
jgi:hypothetical protein